MAITVVLHHLPPDMGFGTNFTRTHCLGKDLTSKCTGIKFLFVQKQFVLKTKTNRYFFTLFSTYTHGLRNFIQNKQNIAARGNLQQKAFVKSFILLSSVKIYIDNVHASMSNSMSACPGSLEHCRIETLDTKLKKKSLLLNVGKVLVV